MLAAIGRQNSQDSSVASERISTAIAVDREDEKPNPVDLEDAERLETRLTGAIERMKIRTAELLAKVSPDPRKWTADEKEQIASLHTAKMQIENQQRNLKNLMIQARKERRELQAEQRQAAMEIHQPKAAPPVRMEELRAMNMVRLDDSDLRARYEIAQKPKPIVPSGGFTGFRVAPDLKRMDFSHSDPNHPDKLEAWRPELYAKNKKR